MKRNQLSQYLSEHHMSFAFGAITVLILLLWFFSTKIMNSNIESFEIVQQNNLLVRHTKQLTINLAKAGLIPKEMESMHADLPQLKMRMAVLAKQFEANKQLMNNLNLGKTELFLVRNLMNKGEIFFNSLAEFLPIKNRMSIYITEYQGKNRPVSDVLTEWDLKHIYYIQFLRLSIKKAKMVVKTNKYNLN
jgi:hypothetical protein